MHNIAYATSTNGDDGDGDDGDGDDGDGEDDSDEELMMGLKVMMLLRLQ